jgi:hypothetical protein
MPNGETLEEFFGLQMDDSSFNPIPKPEEKIFHVQKNDVLLGRGGETNHHTGNVQYRQLVKLCQPAYLEAKRRDKPRIAERIVFAVRRANGRFLKKDPDSNTWSDVGNTRAREKTSQALREGAPELRYSQELRNSHGRGSFEMPDHQEAPLQIYSDHGAVPRRLSLGHSTHQQTHRAAMDEGVVVTALTVEPESSRSPKKRRISPDTAPPVEVQLHSPISATVTVSGDSEEEHPSHASPAAPNNKAIRGPRIKLLKRRLEAE